MGNSVSINKLLELVTLEKTNKEISEEMRISEKYVEYLIKCLFKQFKVKSRVGLVREFMKEKQAKC